MTAERSGGDTTAPPWFREPTGVQRFLGAVVDSIVLLPISLVYFLGRSTATVLVVVAVRAVYEITLTASTGRTVGKIAMGTIALDAVDGSVISLSRAVVRWFVLSGAVAALSLTVGHVGAVPLGSIYVLVVCCSVLPAPLHRGLHDRAAGTLVTSLRPRSDHPRSR